jgi:hypothetical protein
MRNLACDYENCVFTMELMVTHASIGREGIIEYDCTSHSSNQKTLKQFTSRGLLFTSYLILEFA